MAALQQVRDPVQAAYAYHLLRAAVSSFKRAPGDLGPQELQRAETLAGAALELESLVLASREAAQVQVGAQSVQAAFARVAARYADERELRADLLRNGLEVDDLREALQRELRFDATMERVGARAEPVGDVDMQLFYELHRERFQGAEKRLVRHLLITVNDAYPENTRGAALQRLRDLAGRLRRQPRRFGALAREHSECPTALEGGRLGLVEKGKLYPQLDSVLFALRAGEVSDIVESEVGLHLLLCERIDAPRALPFSSAREHIAKLLTERRQHAVQKAWIESLRRGAGAAAL